MGMAEGVTSEEEKKENTRVRRFTKNGERTGRTGCEYTGGRGNSLAQGREPLEREGAAAKEARRALTP